ncbi:DUF4230 domain-containing protein [Aquimarina sp. BL5]|uniref:DUF4230 domain-containing protein n=1 Tax=Aquimarina sp. BL5 TaxID=1714860 RepID=UPI000E477FE5|nr:DUF4230 domain-containing protein [Aquimarina sp. BL5]AXT52403.1 DUF4230 domain-containing protein [Aquimarina sp. BL5]RKN10318.1 DUF4230 domain-containing protein [Aquimarina sp. BL5]
MELLFIGLLIGSVLAYFIFSRFNAAKKRAGIQTQSTILMEKIRSVCKLVTVEGDFAEIYHYESVKEKFFKTIRGKKKALILIDAKAHVGFDLSKIKLDSDTKNKRIVLTQFPKPKLLTIETDFKYYDKKEGWLNPMTSNDLTDINQEAKQFIIDKIPESGLIESAGKELLTVISLMETVAESIGWTLDYSALELDNDPDQKLIN